MQAREEEAKSTHKRKAPTPNPEISKRRKAAEKQRRENEAEERAAATAAQTSPYAELTSRELRDLIFAKTGEKTRKQNHQTLMDALTAIELFQNSSRGKNHCVHCQLNMAEFLPPGGGYARAVICQGAQEGAISAVKLYSKKNEDD